MGTPKAIEAEAVSEDLAPRVPTGLSVQRRLTAEDVVEQLTLIEDAMRAAMKENEDYGVIPGTKKPSLWKSGAEKLGVLFRLAPRFTLTEKDLGGGHREVRAVCDLYHVMTGEWYGQGVGSCSTLEGKYRWRIEKRACPLCKQETVIKGREDYGGGWLCFATKGGCGAKWVDGDQAIEGQTLGKRENPDIADQYNTVLKMALKRSKIDATLAATGASAIFSQDLEDDDPEAKAPPRQSAPANGKTDKRQSTPVDMRPKSKPVDAVQRMLTECAHGVPMDRPCAECQAHKRT